MKLHLLDRTNSKDHSFNVSYNSYPHFLKVWHYHPELELVYVVKSTGTHFIGDHIERFEGGEVVLIGKDVPHMWLNDEKYFEKRPEQMAEAISIHFRKDFLGEAFLDAPETRKIKEMIEMSNRGIKFLNLKRTVKNDIKALLHLEPFDQMIKLIGLLQTLALHRDYQILSSSSFLDTFFKTKNKRLDTIYEYVYKNFKNNINSKDVAQYVGMNPSAFSRFFKRLHRKTFTTYLNEIRVGYACKMLLESDENITTIAYESGFNNLSNFNRQFKVINKMSPSKYARFHKQHLNQ